MVMWKIESVHNELEDKAKEISRKTVGGVSWLLSAAMMTYERCEMNYKRNFSVFKQCLEEI